MSYITYQDMLDRYGNELAYDLLISIEKAARIYAYDIAADNETRLERALIKLNQESDVAFASA